MSLFPTLPVIRPPASIETGGTNKIGLDAKYGLTPTLTADFTANTDFAQVEADQERINLTRYSLFFPEKRDFFLENFFIFGCEFPPRNRTQK